MARRILLLLAAPALASTVGAVLAGGSDPATMPAPIPVLARQFLTIGREAFESGNLPKAAVALRHAIQRAPGLVEAHYLLACTAVKGREKREAIEHFRQVLRLVDAHTADARQTQWREEARRELDRLCVYLKQWRQLCKTFIPQYRQVGLDNKGLPSGVQAFETAALIAPEVADVPEALAALRAKLPDILPAPEEKPDPARADALAEQGATLRRKREHKKAVEPLRKAYALDPNAEILLALTEAYLGCGKPTEAAVVIEAAGRLLVAGTFRMRRRLGARLRVLRRRADPGCLALGRLNSQLALRGEGLARRAVAGKEECTALEIIALVLKLTPDRESALKLKDKLTHTPSACRKLLDLTRKSIQYRSAYKPPAAVTRLRHTIEVKGLRGKSAGVTVTFGSLVWGTKLRATWCIERLDPTDADVYAVVSRFWPMPGGGNIFTSGRRWGVNPYGSKSRITKRPTLRESQEMFREDGTYEITFEKAGTRVHIDIDGRRAWEFVLSDEEAAAAPTRPVSFHMRGTGKGGRPVHMKATLLAFSCSPDCLVKE